VKEPRIQMGLQLRQRLAGGLGADVQGLRRLAQAAQFRRLDEGGHASKLIDGHKRQPPTPYCLRFDANQTRD